MEGRAVNSGLVIFEDLKIATGYETHAEVIACLSRQGVDCLTGKRNRPFLTLAVLEEVLKPGNTGASEKQVIEFN